MNPWDRLELLTPPARPDVERSVLGLMLRQPSLARRLAELPDDLFTLPLHVALHRRFREALKAGARLYDIPCCVRWAVRQREACPREWLDSLQSVADELALVGQLPYYLRCLRRTEGHRRAIRNAVAGLERAIHAADAAVKLDVHCRMPRE